MNNFKKKGFTLVELVIVIAVVAILAAVLIPTFSSIIDKANLSADQSAVRNMNTLLSIEDNPNKEKIRVLEILEEAGFDVENLTPKSKNHRFYWNSTYNIILLVDCRDENNKSIVFPVGIDDVINDFNDSNRSMYSYDLTNLLPGARLEIIGEKQINNNTTLDTSVTFYTMEEVANPEYADWIADFTISFSRELNLIGANPNDNQVILTLAGQYDYFGEEWLPINVAQEVPNFNHIPANQEIRVLSTAIEMMGYSGAITYEFVCDFVKEFSCGLCIETNGNYALSGLIVSLDLRIYEPNVENGKSYCITSYTYTYE